ncbi:MAG TPA: class I SAM-dependent methyltransferase [Candidatus Angelobacter sp.]|jgi:2-polyprenyl-3-methyl-5-hydroxy-6-metoxy-1,4-benzoquinol methylase|nr:class I SAM-dependent methyltransferase [Candidatus Angelobacter sp.]
MPQNEDDNLQARRSWDINAEFWDKRMGEGNDFFNILVWPAVEKLLYPVTGERILDVACGNGLTSRRLARAGARVTAFDFSEAMLNHARKRGGLPEIDYRIVDVTNRDALLDLEVAAFDGALCNMALMDIARIDTLMNALVSLLRPNGRFVFSILHPCFNNPATVQMGELEDRAGDFVTTYSVKISRYLTPFTQVGLAMVGQPEPHPYFHRSLSALLAPAFEAGLALDGLEECAFPADNLGGFTALSWNGHFKEIPPALVARMRRRA